MRLPRPTSTTPSPLADVLANQGGVTDPVVLCAALPHDSVEDTDTTEQELRAAFGDEITGLVPEVTDDKTLDKKLRKQLQIEHARHASPRAKLVKLADNICNLRDIAATPPAEWTATQGGVRRLGKRGRRRAARLPSAAGSAVRRGLAAQERDLAPCPISRRSTPPLCG